MRFRGTYPVKTTMWKPVQTTTKKSSNFTQKITHVDDMIIHNLIKYLVQTRLRLWDIKITNFKPESCPDDLLEICYFYISQKFIIFISHRRSRVWTRYFIRLCIIISSTCVIFSEFRHFFYHSLHRFLRKLWFALDTFLKFRG